MRTLERFTWSRRGLVASVGAAAALSVTAASTMGGFSATIDNSTSNFSSATVQLEEGDGVTTCYSTGTGAGGAVGSANTNTSCGINILGGNVDQVPGGTTLSTTITVTNVGNYDASVASLVAGTCSAANASDDGGYHGTVSGICGDIDITIANTTSGATDKCVYPTQAGTCPSLSSTYTLSTLAGTSFSVTPLTALTAGASATYVINVALDASAQNDAQGLTATVPFTWSISQ